MCVSVIRPLVFFVSRFSPETHFVPARNPRSYLLKFSSCFTDDGLQVYWVRYVRVTCAVYSCGTCVRSRYTTQPWCSERTPDRFPTIIIIILGTIAIRRRYCAYRTVPEAEEMANSCNIIWVQIVFFASETYDRRRYRTDSSGSKITIVFRCGRPYTVFLCDVTRPIARGDSFCQYFYFSVENKKTNFV